MKEPNEVVLQMSNKTPFSILEFSTEGWPVLILQVTGTPLRDSVRIVTKFSDMEQAYSSLNSLRLIVQIFFELHFHLLFDTPNYFHLKVC